MKSEIFYVMINEACPDQGQAFLLSDISWMTANEKSSFDSHRTSCVGNTIRM